MRLEITVDPDLCIGSGDCVRLAPHAFAIDETSGVSIPLAGGSEGSHDLMLQAAMGCPTQAIRVVADGVVLHESNG